MDDLLATIQSADPNAPPAAAVAAVAPAPGAAPQAVGGFDPTKSYGTPSKLLDNLQAEESSGNPYAVNQTTQAMGPYQFTPSTVAMLRQKGVKFDPFDPQQARTAADYYLQQLKQQNGGTYQGVLKAYGGFVHADPTQYIAKAMNGVQAPPPAPTIPGQSNSGQQPQGYTGPMSDLFATLQQGGQAAQQPAPAAPAGQQPPQQSSSGPLARFGQSAAGLADTVLSAPGAAAQSADYAVRRAFQQNPAQAQAAAGQDFGGAAHPIGNAFGVTNTPAYQNEATQRAQQAIGGAVGKGVNAVAGATGVAPQDVASAAGSLSMLVPGAVGRVAPVLRDAAAATAADDLNVRATPAAAPTGPAMEARPVVGGGAASANLNPYPQLTGEDTSRGAFPQVKLSKVASDVTPDEQERASIANQIMGDNAGSVRTGVLTGNENTLRDEYAAAKTPNQTPVTQALRAQIANEQQALSNYAEQRVNATGASQILTNDEQRGRTINDAVYGPSDSLTSYFRDVKQDIYDEARQQEGDNAAGTQNIERLLNNPQFQARVTGRGNANVVRAAQQYLDLARNGGIEDPITGQMALPNSVGAMDIVRKAMNGMWSDNNHQTVAEINAALDRDVSAPEGNALFRKGDQVHQLEKTILSTPGIGSILGDYDANGVKVGTALETIPEKLNNMPEDRWQHLRNVLDDLSRGQIQGAPENMPPVPQGVMDAAGQARSEMDGALARSVYEAGSSKAGVWNQNASNKVLNSTVGQKIMRNFSPDEVQAFHTLNYGGQIMPGVHSYEGAGNQLARLNKPGFVERYAPHASTSAGAAIGGAIPIPGAGYLGAITGERLGRGLSDIAAGRRQQAQLRDITSEMQQNAQLGAQSNGVPLNSLMKKGKP